ncbi:uracil phosphoribosyltransferase [Clostridia bacterium]|nr:uracil phosphoribosyltransferase [Clostridia bacterium]
MSRLLVLDHPLVKHKLSRLREKATGSKEFRELVCELSMLLCYEATRELPVEKKDIETPMAKAEAQVLLGKKMAIIPILRAGLGMVDGMLQMIPSAKVGHIGLYRDPDTLMPVEYYCKLPPNIDERNIFVIDPMLATGGSASDAITQIKRAGGKSIKQMSILGTPEGVANLQKQHPDVDIFLCAIDKCLNKDGMIIPGLGDAGDRIFGTK